MQGLVVAACGLLILSMPHAAAARPYTVVSCDSAGVFGYSSAAWEPFGNAGNAYKSCPSGGGPTAGISNRLVGSTYSGFSHSGHGITAPPGATITHVRWAGRMARNNCRWATCLRALPSGGVVMGLPTGSYCDTTGFDNRGWPMTFAAPGGTTRLEQLINLRRRPMSPRATMHAQILEVTVDDPIPPSISLGGPLASGQWVSGRGGEPNLVVAARDNAGVRNVTTSVGAQVQSESYPCTFALARPCSDQTTSKAVPNWRPSRWPPFPDRFSHRRGRKFLQAMPDIYVDNTAPDPVAPQVIGGGAWRRTNHFGIGWTNPADRAAPIVRAHWKICTTDGSCPSRGQRDGTNIQGLPSLRVPAPGEDRLHVWLKRRR